MSQDSSTRVDVETLGGDLRAEAGTVRDLEQSDHNLSGTIGGGDGTLDIHTMSGNVTIAR